ncbi:cytochrome c3 family protein [Mucilaginibacter sp. AW1-3]
MMRRSKKAFFILLIALLPVAACLTQCLYQSKATDVRGAAYAGSVSCKQCHKDVYSSYLHTAHFETSRQAGTQTVHGSFAPGENTFDFGTGQKMVMQKRDSGLYQTGYVNGQQVETERFDMVIGGVKAETYLYWKGDKLFELPMSYFKNLHGWTNSPGYAKGIINFDRPIVTRCLECHSSYISEVPQQSAIRQQPEFDKNSLIYGIDCERCHGPAAKHVAFHLNNPNEKEAHFMVSYKSLTRDQKLNTCAVCHSGNREKFELSAFNFKPGDTLDNFKVRDYFPQKQNLAGLDVHGNQNGLLSASKCFLMSNMDCMSCHNTHVNDRGNVAMYSQKCMNCHNTANHNTCTVKQVAARKANCIDCHMPEKASAIAVQTATERNITPYLVRTHLIAVYPEESKKIMDFIKNTK